MATARGSTRDARGSGRDHPSAVHRRHARAPRRVLRGRQRPAVRPARPPRSPSSSRVSGRSRRHWRAGSATATGATPPTRAHRRVRGGRRDGPAVRTARTSAGRSEDAAAREDRVPGVAEHCRTRSAVAGPADLDALRAGDRDRDRGRRHERRCRAGPTSSDERASTASARYVDAGYDHLYFHQIGDDQDGFFRYWESELEAALR